MNAKKTINAKTVGAVAAAVAAFIAYMAVTHGLNFAGNSVERQIEKFSADTNKRLPMQIDKATRWDRVEPGPGRSYSYVYTISKEMTDREKQAAKESTTRQALAAPDMQATFAAGVTVWYRYYDASGKKVLEFSVTK